jgi:hypothetical protein
VTLASITPAAVATLSLPVDATAAPGAVSDALENGITALCASAGSVNAADVKAVLRAGAGAGRRRAVLQAVTTLVFDGARGARRQRARHGSGMRAGAHARA